jgi:hypothetical protein
MSERWHPLWSHHQSLCCCTDGKHNEKDCLTVGRIAALELELTAAKAARDALEQTLRDEMADFAALNTTANELRDQLQSSEQVHHILAGEIADLRTAEGELKANLQRAIEGLEAARDFMAMFDPEDASLPSGWSMPQKQAAKAIALSVALDGLLTALQGQG